MQELTMRVQSLIFLCFLLMGVVGTLIVEDNAEVAEVKFQFGESLSGAKHRGSFSKMPTHFIFSYPPSLEDKECNFISHLNSTRVGGRYY